MWQRAWQVISPAMANKLVLNRGAMFSKFSYKRASVGVRYKEDRLVRVRPDVVYDVIRGAEQCEELRNTDVTHVVYSAVLVLFGSVVLPAADVLFSAAQYYPACCYTNTTYSLQRDQQPKAVQPWSNSDSEHVDMIDSGLAIGRQQDPMAGPPSSQAPSAVLGPEPPEQHTPQGCEADSTNSARALLVSCLYLPGRFSGSAHAVLCLARSQGLAVVLVHMLQLEALAVWAKRRVHILELEAMSVGA